MLDNLNSGFMPRRVRGGWLAFAVAASCVVSSTASGGFTTVIEAPPTAIAPDPVFGNDTQINIRAGAEIGPRMEFGLPDSQNSNIEVNIYDNDFLPSMQANSGTVVNFIDNGLDFDAQVRRRGFNPVDGSQVNFYQGWLGWLNTRGPSVANLAGGRIENVRIYPEGQANIYGGLHGRIDDSINPIRDPVLDVSYNGTLNWFGTEFSYDGQLLDLELGVPHIIESRGGSIVGTLADGSPIDYVLDQIVGFPLPAENNFDSNATIMVTLVSGLDGDYNNDGFVSQADLDMVLLNWGEHYVPQGWVPLNQFDGDLISQNELDAVLLNWGDGTPGSALPNPAAVPEPGVGGVLLVGLSMTWRRRRVAGRKPMSDRGYGR